jgi:prostaglandin-E synthase
LITIALPDPIDPKINVDASGKLEFSAKAGADKTPYELDLELAGEIDNEVGATVSAAQVRSLEGSE